MIYVMLESRVSMIYILYYDMCYIDDKQSIIYDLYV